MTALTKAIITAVLSFFGPLTPEDSDATNISLKIEIQETSPYIGPYSDNFTINGQNRPDEYCFVIFKNTDF